ncbi:MAG: methyl-accepting chemotaxis protein [Geothrix sp.]|nr:methyl-accepting chemotaxis protein [Geothrix sp.]
MSLPASLPMDGPKVVDPEQLTHDLVGLEEVISRSAAGAARTSVRVQTLAGEIDQILSSTRDIQATLEGLGGNISQAASAAEEGAESTRLMADLTRQGRQETDQAVTTVRHLQEQTQITSERLESLLGHILQVNEVSLVIGEIADRTGMLSLNAAIEAAHAGAAGRGFAVVADEVRKLADRTSRQTQEIAALLEAIRKDLDPAREAMDRSVDLASSTRSQVEAVEQRFSGIADLAESTAGHVSSLARTAAEEQAAAQTLVAASGQLLDSTGKLKAAADAVAHDAFSVSSLTEEGHRHLAAYDTGSLFHRALRLGRDLATTSAGILAAPVSEGKLSAEDLLALDYREIRGTEIHSLSRFFNVVHVPPEGFTPPKYRTAYDALVELPLQQAFDRVLEQEPRLTFALILDLNSYAPSHNKVFSKDWTGQPAKDLAGNRVKRFFTDNQVLVRGARHGLGEVAETLPDRVSRRDFQGVADLAEQAANREEFLVQTYARDTGAIITVLTVPLYVCGQRYGASLLGWSSEG